MPGKLLSETMKDHELIESAFLDQAWILRRPHLYVEALSVHAWFLGGGEPSFDKYSEN